MLDALVRHKLAAEQAGVLLDQSWHTVDDQRFGLIITPAGLKAIGVETDAEGEVTDV